MGKPSDLVIGTDFGTSSVRTIVVDANTGDQMAVSEFEYPRWNAGNYCDPSKNQFRQHPLDYIEGLQQTVRDVVFQLSPEQQSGIRALSIDTTGSTPVAVDEKGIPLALYPEFGNNPNAMFHLWKDHTAIQEAEAINEHSKQFEVDYLQYVGGIYSSEWFWAKLLHVLRSDMAVRKACYSWVEHCDWMPFLLTGGHSVKHMKAGVCAAGHKALWSERWGGLPPEGFFVSLDPLLSGFTNRLYKQTYTADIPAGNLCPEWAEKLGLSTEVLVGVGTLDAHVGAVGGQISPYYMSKVMGTSTCDMLAIPIDDIGDVLVDGICGQVKGSIIPGMIGLEAGQSAFGDIFAWFSELLAWPIKQQLDDTTSETKKIWLKSIEASILEDLTASARQLSLDLNAEIAVDWFNGRRTPDADQSLKGAMKHLSLGSDAPRIFRSLVEATCFGAKKIVERFTARRIPIKGIIGVGGVAKKSPFIMQMMADVLQMPIKVNESDQTSALGAAMFAATVAGIYPKVEDAMKGMGKGFDMEYLPDDRNKSHYQQRYRMYLDLCAATESSSSELKEKKNTGQ